jgi:uncharacterized protein (TIGR02284 family)
MATTQKAVVGLADETLDKLRELRRLNVDSAKGFEESAGLVDHNVLKQVFTEIAHERRDQARVLAEQIEWNEGDESEHGSYVAAMHRSWMKVRDALSSDSTQTVLEEAERGEDAIKDAYEDAVSCCVGSPIHAVINEQYLRVKKTHDRIRDLRDSKKCC